jgi:predicted porin
LPLFEKEIFLASLCYNAPVFETPARRRFPTVSRLKGERPMSLFRSVTLRYAPAALLVFVALSSGPAKAEVTLFDQDGWTFRINGLVAAHYQLVRGDADPNARLNLAGGRILDEGASADESDPNNRKLMMSGIRSGFLGTQIGFGVRRQISQDVYVDSMLSLWVNGINSNRGQDTPIPKVADYREAWAAIVSPIGTLKFGRMFGLFASGSAEVQLMAWKYGVGHPCVLNHATVSCGSTGAGPLYPGFDAAIRYSTPRFAGFQFVVSVADPNVSPTLKISRYPRVDTELSFDNTFGGLRVRLMGQSMWVRIGKTDLSDPTNASVLYRNVWGVMGTGIVSYAGLTVGGGAWQGSGIGERIPLEANDPANPISNDNTGKLREGRGFYGNASYSLAGNTLTVGGGKLYVKPTAQDKLAVDNFPLTEQQEGHVVFTHAFAGGIVVNVEYMHWFTGWLRDPMPDPTTMQLRPRTQQTINFMGAGINYVF